MAAWNPFWSGSVYIIFPFWWYFLKSIADQSLENNIDYLLEGLFVLHYWKGLFPVCHFPWRRENSFLRSLTPHLNNMGTRTEEGFMSCSFGANILCSFLRFLIWNLIGPSDHIKMLTNHYPKQFHYNSKNSYNNKQNLKPIWRINLNQEAVPQDN